MTSRECEKSWTPDELNELYRRSPDPWDLASRPYERAKYRRTIEALEGRRFARGLEVGCSIGLLTECLSRSTDRLVAIDASAAAVSTARNRCAKAGVEVCTMCAPDEWPPGVFDLIVLSEVLYFMNAHDVARTAARVRASIADAGLVVLVNYLGDMPYPLGGEEAGRLFISAMPAARSVKSLDCGDYRLDLLRP